MRRAILCSVLAVLCMGAGDGEIEGWRIIKGEWKDKPISGQGYLEYEKTIQGKFELSAKLTYDLKTDDVFGLGLYPQDGSFVTVFVEGKSQLSIRMKPAQGETKTIGNTKANRTGKKAVFRCQIKGSQIQVSIGASRVAGKLPVTLDGAKVRLCSVGQTLTFGDLEIKE